MPRRSLRTCSAGRTFAGEFRQVVFDDAVFAAGIANDLAEFEILADLGLLVAGDEQVLEVVQILPQGREVFILVFLLFHGNTCNGFRRPPSH